MSNDEYPEGLYLDLKPAGQGAATSWKYAVAVTDGARILPAMKNKSGRLVWPLLAAVALLSAGCGSFGGSYSASPASLMLLKNDAKPVTVPGAEATSATSGPASLLTVD